MVKFQAIVNGQVVAEGATMKEADEKARAQGYTEITFRSVRTRPRV